MSKRGSSRRWLREHARDPYVQQARKQGYRSRAVFKLMQIQDKDRILAPGMTVVDLGAAPGGWSQFARERVGERGRVLALDRLEMAPLPGVTFIRGDFREDEVLRTLEQAMSGARADLVLSDMAPNISGVSAQDQAGTMYLAELALDFARGRLAAGGALLVKLFQGEGFDGYLGALRGAFGRVVIRKPEASRARSRELYLLARDHRIV